MELFSGQGTLYIATRDGSGNAGPFRDVGNVKDFKFNLATTTISHKESKSGQRLTDHRLITEKQTTISGIFDDFNIDNLALALYGTKATTAGSSVTNEAFPTVAVGDFVRTKYPDISAITVKDSFGTPATLTLGTHYEITSAKHGTVKFLNLASFTQPFKIDYTYASHTHVPMFDTAPPERWLKFDGINTANSDKKVLVEFYRTLLDPLSELATIQESGYGELPLAGAALYDDTKAADTYLKQFGRWVSFA
jgi:hypothetical protein